MAVAAGALVATGHRCLVDDVLGAAHDPTAASTGVVAGPALPYLLNDGSLLGVPAAHTLGANGEIIDGIGVAPDYNAPTTPQDLSTGHDPAVDKALTLLGH